MTTIQLVDVSCQKCNGLLCRAEETFELEVVCPRCRSINYPSHRYGQIGVRGVAFQDLAVDIRDPLHGTLLLRAIGIGQIEVKSRKGPEIWEFEISHVPGFAWQAPQKSVVCTNLTKKQRLAMLQNKRKIAL